MFSVKDEALWRLAKRLFVIMERLDPSPSDIDWESLSGREREFYRLCVESMFEEADLADIVPSDDTVAFSPTTTR
jgi:hypothetical protein